MANFARGPEQLARWINSCLIEAPDNLEMLILPLAGVSTSDELKLLLQQISGFSFGHTDGNSVAVITSPGLIGRPAGLTIDDALSQLSGGLISVYLLSAAIEAQAAEHVEGKTSVVTILGNPLIINRESFAQKAGISLTETQQKLFTVYLPYSKGGTEAEGSSRIFVAVAGEAKPEEVGKGFSLDQFFPSLEQRSLSAFENCAHFTVEGMENGWQLYHNARFNEFLGLLRSGYSYQATSEKGNLVVTY